MDWEEAEKFILEKKKEYLAGNFYLHTQKYFKGRLRYLSVRTGDKKHFYSWNAIRLSKKEWINGVLVDDSYFCDLYPNKRNTQIAMRMSEEEYKILKELAKKHNVKPATLLRSALRYAFENEIEAVAKKLKLEK